MTIVVKTVKSKGYKTHILKTGQEANTSVTGFGQLRPIYTFLSKICPSCVSNVSCVKARFKLYRCLSWDYVMKSFNYFKSKSFVSVFREKSLFLGVTTHLLGDPRPTVVVNSASANVFLSVGTPPVPSPSVILPFRTTIVRSNHGDHEWNPTAKIKLTMSKKRATDGRLNIGYVLKHQMATKRSKLMAKAMYIVTICTDSPTTCRRISSTNNCSNRTNDGVDIDARLLNIVIKARIFPKTPKISKIKSTTSVADLTASILSSKLEYSAETAGDKVARSEIAEAESGGAEMTRSRNRWRPNSCAKVMAPKSRHRNVPFRTLHDLYISLSSEKSLCDDEN
uniref:Uncharacterized protein n=1 Tax=Romanomermis culicivorax TaxID=13658 RepID=A0A915JTC1_ROMCU